ncbi:MAG: CoA transferase [Halieaceae bacterium]|jgi:crotonobetainyl-CoA:carnitine CoA-transferase CaiB-like acyl-CoA transferase|nr:CoA transferase [Halieaceae bacterium]
MGKDLLKNIRIADLTHYRSGPSGTTLLGGLGADVIKVESIQRLDGFRLFNTLDPKNSAFYEMGPYFNGCNTNKRGLTLDLNSVDGKARFLELITKSDVVIDNFSARVMDGLDLGYERLKAINPSLIMVSMTCFGQTGPWRDYVGFGYTFDQIGGASAVCGYEDSPPTNILAASDAISGIMAVYAILLALEERERSGLGQHIDMSQVETLAFLMGPNIIDYQLTGAIKPRMGNQHPVFAPRNAYPCQGEDEWVTISVESDLQWSALAIAMGNPEWVDDPRYATMASRKRNERDLDKVIADWTRGQQKRSVMELVQSLGIASAMVLNARELLEDPHLKDRNMHKKLDRKFTGEHLYPQFPIHYSDAICEQRMPAPTLGQDNEAVLADLLGLTTQEIEKLRQDNVIGEELLLGAGSG